MTSNAHQEQDGAVGPNSKPVSLTRRSIGRHHARHQISGLLPLKRASGFSDFQAVTARLEESQLIGQVHVCNDAMGKFADTGRLGHYGHRKQGFWLA